MNPSSLTPVVIDEARAELSVGADQKPITVIGTEPIRQTLDQDCLRQAIACRQAPGVTDVVINPDAHGGHGVPVGCVMVSPTHIYPAPVGVDIKCSMSLLQTDLPSDMIEDHKTRRQLISAICQRIPTGPSRGQKSVPKSRRVSLKTGRQAVIDGASPNVCRELGIPSTWAERCEDAAHVGHDGSQDALAQCFERHLGCMKQRALTEKLQQLGSLGGGNHFGECDVVHVSDNRTSQEVANHFGLKNGHVAFLTHCGSRGFGFHLASEQFHTLQEMFEKWHIPLPGECAELVYAPVDTPQANAYLDDMALGGNFATVNHLLINAVVLEAFQEVFPGIQGELVYFISHNIAKKERVDGEEAWVHRKGATRAFPAGHPDLAETRFAKTGHPILLPGDPVSGSAVMVADSGAANSCFSVNHGAGRLLGRSAAKKQLDQTEVDQEFYSSDILSNCRKYPIDEAPAVYKDFDEVLRSVEIAGLAREVARLKAKFVIKDGT